MRLTGDQVITAGANGAALTMDMLDDLVDAVRGTPSVLVMNKAMRRAVVKLARSSQVLSITRDYFGREVEAYGGVPMAVIEDDADGDAILGFDETQGTDATTASLYACRFGVDNCHGIQTNPVDDRHPGQQQPQPAPRPQ